jgi:hypothetical protein
LALATGLNLDRLDESEDSKKDENSSRSLKNELFKDFGQRDSTFEVNYIPQDYSHDAPDFVNLISNSILVYLWYCYLVLKILFF